MGHPRHRGNRRASFLPALRAAGDGVAVSVASRDRERAERWATEHGVGHGIEGYVTEQSAAPDGEPSFTPAIRHIHRVLRGLEPPRHLAVDEAMGNATAIAALLDAARS